MSFRILCSCKYEMTAVTRKKIYSSQIGLNIILSFFEVSKFQDSNFTPELLFDFIENLHTNLTRYLPSISGFLPSAMCYIMKVAAIKPEKWLTYLRNNGWANLGIIRGVVHITPTLFTGSLFPLAVVFHRDNWSTMGKIWHAPEWAACRLSNEICHRIGDEAIWIPNCAHTGEQGKGQII